MPSRRSHQKSRRGCLACKQAHIKCREDGPPCERCRLRGTTCTYPDPPPSLRQDNTSPPKNGLLPAPGADDESQPAEEPQFPSSTRLLELQLMHRWSTVTYKSVCTPAAGDGPVWRDKLPKWALRHDFLLNGMLSLTAFEAASASVAGQNRDRYVTAAIEYQSVALTQFRQHLQLVQMGPHRHPSNSSFEPVLAFSMMLMVLALASAQFTGGQGMVQNTITHYQLIRGCGTVLGDAGEEYLASNPYVLKLTRFDDLPRLPVDSPSAVVLARLNEANERRLTGSVGEPYEARVQHVKYFEACKKSIGLLEQYFAKCMGDVVDESYQGYILGWLNMAGDEYVSAIKDGDRVALLVLMLWGAVVEQLGHKVWWARRFGRLVVEEIAMQVGKDGDADALTREIIALAIEWVVRART
ncbi:hypothetical protein A1O7_06111 [Cladophialophora yegresii CBS 114405]|uniref:Zn(2)-C6 fungal-type domain-containing protein n=1 Tax=Cladophialophora yegresii CBS 114405 TaxID=1182544 RepID=W9VSF6_9EURO|nr:uncharacterized protein A1O7_06111 [Cladophialophora yegresii CBS 114405]EXJ58682.1 hypothetical protein A1O7_06111 [Cladophialophora yegresii CBS 114405]